MQKRFSYPIMKLIETYRQRTGNPDSEASQLACLNQDMVDVNDKFGNWLTYRQVAQNTQRDKVCYDANEFLNKNGAIISGKKDPVVERYDPLVPNESTLKFPHRVEQSINNHLEKLDSFTITEVPIFNDNGEPLVQSVRAAQGDLEPVWSSTKIQNPAELLLPNQHRLFVTTTGPELIEQASDDYNYKPKTSFKNNLCCTYGEYMFAVMDSAMLVYKQSKFAPPFVRFEYITDEVGSNQYYNYGMSKTNHRYISDVDTSSDEVTANYICIKRLFDRDVLVVCDTSAIITFFDLSKMVRCFENIEPTESEINYNDCERYWEPIIALKVPESCWSIDVITIEQTVFIAAGHNLPGVSLFALERNQTTYTGFSSMFSQYSDEENELEYRDRPHYFNVISCELFSEHNVPSLTFTKPDSSLPKKITLAYGSIYGNVTTVEIDTDISDRSLHVQLIDTQFFGEQVWSVTALKKKDFLKVPQFELLNLNFQERLKESIHRSILMDSKILGLYPRSVYNSGNYGIGSITTQIPVPTAKLGWSCLNGIKSPQVELTFTTFDKEGKKTKGLLNDQISSYNFELASLNERPSNTLERLENLLEDDRLSFTYKYANNQKVGLQDESRYGDIWRQNDFELKATNKIENSTGYSGFTLVSETEIRDIEERNITEHNNILYIPKPSGRYDFLDTNKAPVLLAPSEYYYRYYKSPSWGDIMGSKIEESTRKINEGTPTEGDLESQRRWWVHNHIRKVKKLVETAIPGHEQSGFKLPSNDNDILLITTENNVYLAKPSPLVVTSFTGNDVFPIKDVNVCINKNMLEMMNRINIVCHIKELNCVAIASQIGLVSLLRLTEFRGIYSFRQEYIIGWKSQNPLNEGEHSCIQSCIRNKKADPCTQDDLLLPLYSINGMCYNYFSENKAAGVVEHAELIISHQFDKQRFKIFAGDKVVV